MLTSIFLRSWVSNMQTRRCQHCKDEGRRGRSRSAVQKTFPWLAVFLPVFLLHWQWPWMTLRAENKHLRQASSATAAHRQTGHGCCGLQGTEAGEFSKASTATQLPVKDNSWGQSIFWERCVGGRQGPGSAFPGGVPSCGGYLFSQNHAASHINHHHVYHQLPSASLTELSRAANCAHRHYLENSGECTECKEVTDSPLAMWQLWGLWFLELVYLRTMA